MICPDCDRSPCVCLQRVWVEKRQAEAEADKEVPRE